MMTDKQIQELINEFKGIREKDSNYHMYNIMFNLGGQIVYDLCNKIKQKEDNTKMLDSVVNLIKKGLDYE